jgi:homoserine/homoserine lactone efflux protein
VSLAGGTTAYFTIIHFPFLLELSNMDLPVFLAFVFATALMIALPGPSVLLTIAHSLSFGWKRALATVAGATMGIAVQLLVATIGLAALLHAVAAALEWLCWAGAAYLVYLGIRQWRSASEPLTLGATPVTTANLFVQGLVITIPNPKSLIFIAAFLPQFIDGTRSLGLQFAYIVPTFLAITFAVTSVWALAAGAARGLLQSPRILQFVLRMAGACMIIAGIGLALTRHGN